MAAPNLALRNALYVNYVGTDDPGYDTIGHPWSYRTLAAALASLAIQSNPPSPTNPWTIAIGPGVLVTPGFQLPAWVWITGCADGETGESTTLQLTGNVSLASSWAAGASQGGFSNLVMRKTGAQVLDLTMPAPASGNPTRILQLENVTTDLQTINWQATGTGDALDSKRFVQDGSATDAITLLNGSIRLNNFQSAADVRIGDAGGATAALLFGLCLLPGTSLSLVATAQAVTVALLASQVPDLILTRTAGSLSVLADAISLPVRASIAITGTVTLTRANDANGEGYIPTTPGDWTSQPTTVQQALDILAASGGGGGGINWTLPPPVNSTDAGLAGEISYDGFYYYICVATNTWIRTPMSSW